MEKCDVNGEDAHKGFQWLRKKTELKGGDIPWNFAKFLISGDGKIVKYYDPKVEPLAMRDDIKEMLKHKFDHSNKDEL